MQYSKHFEELVLTGKVDEVWKNIPTKTIDHQIIKFFKELKRGYETSSLPAELDTIIAEIANKTISQELKLRKELLEFDLKTTTEERKKEIINSLQKTYCGMRYEYQKPNFVTKWSSENASTKEKSTTLPSVLTEELIEKQFQIIKEQNKNNDLFEVSMLSSPYLKPTKWIDWLQSTKDEKKITQILTKLFDNTNIPLFLFTQSQLEVLVGYLNKQKTDWRFNVENLIKTWTVNQLKYLLKHAFDKTVYIKALILNEIVAKTFDSPDEKWNKIGAFNKALDKYKLLKQEKSKETISVRQNTLSEVLRLSQDANIYDLDIYWDYLNLSKEDSTIHIYEYYPELLTHFLQEQPNLESKFTDLINTNTLNLAVITAKIYRGEDIQYNTNELAKKLLSIEQYEKLCTAKKLTILNNNKSSFDIDETVVLNFEIKNIQSMNASVFEINTENYYKSKKQAITSWINVEGLITKYEDNYTFPNEKSQKIIKQTITFDKIPNKRGVFIIEITGNGISTRAVIKKGNYNLIERPSPKGKTCYILDENNNICKGESTYITYKNVKYYADKDKGIILIPYVALDHSDNICILSHENYSDIAKISWQKADYSLSGVFHLHNEMLLTGNLAKITLKPWWTFSGRVMSWATLKNCSIEVLMEKCQNNQTTPVSTKFENIEFTDEMKDYEIEVQIQPMISKLNIVFSGEVTNPYTSFKQQMKIMETLEIVHPKSSAIYEWYLRGVNNTKTKSINYILEVLGTNGQAKPETKMNVALHYNTKNVVPNIEMITDENGTINLGNLKNVNKVNVKSVDSTLVKEFIIQEEPNYLYPGSIDAIESEEIILPFYSTFSSIEHEVSLISVVQRNDYVIENLTLSKHWTTKQWTINNNTTNYKEIILSNLPQGKYILQIKSNRIQITIHKGKKWWVDEIIITKDKIVENITTKNLLHLTSFSIKNNEIKFSTGLKNRKQFAHIYLSQYFQSSLTNSLKKVQEINCEIHSKTQQTFSKWDNIFLSNRTLNEEIQYVLERKNYDCTMGNSWEMPSLWLKRQFTQKSSLEEEKLAKGSNYQEKKADLSASGAAMKDQIFNPIKSIGNRYSSHLNFISQAPLSILNVQPDTNGEYCIHLPNADILKEYSIIEVVVFDNHNFTSNAFILNDENYKVKTRSLALDDCWDNTKNMLEIQKKEVHLKDEKIILSESADYKIIDSIEKVVNYILLKNPEFKDTWNKVSFLLNVDNEEKFLEKYSEFISHEANIFIYFKYPDLFKKYVKDILKYKFEKTLIDYFLLDDMNTLEKYLIPSKIADLNWFEICLLVIKFVNAKPDVAEALKNIIKSRVAERDVDEVVSRNFDTVMNIQAKDEGKPEEEDEREEDELQGESQVDGVGQQRFGGNRGDSARANFQGRGGNFNWCGMQRQEEDEDWGIQQQQNYPQQVMFSSAYAPQEPQIQMAQGCFLQSQPMFGGQSVNLMATQAQQVYGASHWNCLPQSLAARNRTVPYQMPGMTQADVRPPDQLFDSSNINVKKVANYEEPGGAKEYKERHYLSNSHKIQLNSPIWFKFAEYIISNKTTKDFLNIYILYNQVSFSEWMWIISVLDLPITSAKHEYNRIENRQIEITAKSNLLLFSKGFSDGISKWNPKIMISQNISVYNSKDENVSFTNLKTGEIYWYETIITNISDKNVSFDWFTQLPQGAIPCHDTYYYQTEQVKVNTYQTISVSKTFYFPKIGTFRQYHPIISKKGVIISVGTPMNYIVNENRSYLKDDSNDGAKKVTLEEILSKGDKSDILKFFKDNNGSTENNVAMVLWWLKDKDFFMEFIKILQEYSQYFNTVWSFSFYHYYLDGIKQFLENNQQIKNTLQAEFSSSLIHIDKYNMLNTFNHLDYTPVLNARVHVWGKEETGINNISLRKTYEDFIMQLIRSRSITVKNRWRLVYYLILQERMDEALKIFERVDINEITKSKDCDSLGIQYDYISAYLDFCFGFPKFETAKKMCTKYKDFPLLHWRDKFEEIEDQWIEYEGKELVGMDSLDFELLDVNQSTKPKTDKALKKELRENLSKLSFTIENKKTLEILNMNVAQITIKFYLLDWEILFSRSPYIQNLSKDFSYVQPNYSTTISISSEDMKKESITKFDIPQEYLTKNIFIEVSCASVREFKMYFSANLNLWITEKIGEIKVCDMDMKPVTKAYVKCFADIQGEGIKFYKDGYTDLRGKFNYVELNTNQLRKVNKFYLFVCDDNLGAMIKECLPPKNINLTGDDYELMQQAKQSQRGQWRKLNKVSK